MEIVYFTIVAIGLYAIILPLALITFWLPQTFGPA